MHAVRLADESEGDAGSIAGSAYGDDSAGGSGSASDGGGAALLGRSGSGSTPGWRTYANDSASGAGAAAMAHGSTGAAPSRSFTTPPTAEPSAPARARAFDDMRGRTVGKGGDDWFWLPESTLDELAAGDLPTPAAPLPKPRKVTRKAFTLEDGSRFEGGFADGEFEGPGTYVTPTYTFDGVFRRGQYHGQGLLQQTVAADKPESYWGDFFDNRKHGRCVWRFPAMGPTSVSYTKITWKSGSARSLSPAGGRAHAGGPGMTAREHYLGGNGTARGASGITATDGHKAGESHAAGGRGADGHHDHHHHHSQHHGKHKHKHHHHHHTHHSHHHHHRDASRRGDEEARTPGSGESPSRAEMPRNFSFGTKASRTRGRSSSRASDVEGYDEYRGEVQDDHINGRGVMKYSSGDKYDGLWLNGEWHGWGRLDRADGAWRQGEWRAGVPDGYGTARDAAGAIFEGSWKDGKWNGSGELKAPNGTLLYSGYWANGRPHGRGYLLDKQGGTYDGEWRHGVRHGYGVSVDVDGSKYDGTWTEGLRHGRGVVTASNGTVVWDGEMHSGQRHGRGILRETVSAAATYSGTGSSTLASSASGPSHEAVAVTWDGRWSYGSFHGMGTCERSDGEVYTGEWSYGERHGRGYHHSKDGTTYDGDWRQNVRHGYGRLIMSSGEVYEGDWMDGMQHGKGKHTAIDGEKYDGEFRNGVRHGEGRCKYPDGGEYIGPWEGGHRSGAKAVMHYSIIGATYKGAFRYDAHHGFGTLAFHKHNRVTQYSGEWFRGVRRGHGVEEYSSGDRYEGDFDNDLPQGQGTLYMTSTGDRYEGAFREGNFDGVGSIYYHNGDSYRGDFRAGLQHGQGVFTAPRLGAWYAGQWKSGLREGRGKEWFPDAGCVYSGYFEHGNPAARGEYRFAFTRDVIVQTLSLDEDADSGEGAARSSGESRSKASARGSPTRVVPMTRGYEEDSKDGDDDVSKRILAVARHGARTGHGKLLFSLRPPQVGQDQTVGDHLTAWAVMLFSIADIVMSVAAFINLAALGSNIPDTAPVANTGVLGFTALQFWMMVFGVVLAACTVGALAESRAVGLAFALPTSWAYESIVTIRGIVRDLAYFNVHTFARALAPTLVDDGSPVRAPDAHGMIAAYDDQEAARGVPGYDTGLGGRTRKALAINHRYPVLRVGDTLAFFRLFVGTMAASGPALVIRLWALMELVGAQLGFEVPTTDAGSVGDVTGVVGGASDGSATGSTLQANADLSGANWIVASLFFSGAAVIVAIVQHDVRGLVYHRLMRLHSAAEASRRDDLPDWPRVSAKFVAVLASMRAFEVAGRVLIVTMFAFRFGPWALLGALLIPFAGGAFISLAGGACSAAVGAPYVVRRSSIRMARARESAVAAAMHRDDGEAFGEGIVVGYGADDPGEDGLLDGGGGHCIRRVRVWVGLQMRVAWTYCGQGASAVAIHSLLQASSALLVGIVLPTPYMLPPLHRGFPGPPNFFVMMRCVEEIVELSLLWRMASDDPERHDFVTTGWLGVFLALATLVSAGRVIVFSQVRAAMQRWVHAPTPEVLSPLAKHSQARLSSKFHRTHRGDAAPDHGGEVNVEAEGAGTLDEAISDEEGGATAPHGVASAAHTAKT